MALSLVQRRSASNNWQASKILRTFIDMRIREVVHLKYNPILYRQEQQQQKKNNNSIYYHFHSIAMMYMRIVGSSVPCERLFSIAGDIASDERNRLDPSRLHRLLFLKSLDVKHWDL
ncbi:hypothetical protein TNCV_2656111 [Trichonephila clavipes]|nr:hypothetical protein TNCV_2656111 [Trichonephila clavipes]